MALRSLPLRIKPLAAQLSPAKPRRSQKTAARGYGADWQRLRKAFIQQNPLCAQCQKEGRATAAAVVDHIIPHRGDDSLRMDWSNLQSLCRPHHASWKQHLEKRLDQT